MTSVEHVTFSPMKGISLKEQWHCPTCGVSVTTFITLTEPPTHTCKKQRSQTLPLKKKDQK